MIDEKDFPALTGVDSKGNTRCYKIAVEGSTIIKHWGLQGKKQQEHRETITEGKNIGKANETTPFQQACAEAASDWQKKLDGGYNEEGAGLNTKILPMLAHPYSKRGHNINWPAMCQPKLDGVRVLAFKVAEGQIKYQSRKGKEIKTLHHLDRTLDNYMLVGEIFDGEIYIHGAPFQEIVSLAKNVKKDTERLEFWVFDTVSTRMRNVDRMSLLTERNIPEYTTNTPVAGGVCLVPCSRLAGSDQIEDKHSEYVAAGFEGIIIRNRAGLYKVKHRSADLQKYKSFIDEEFTIINAVRDSDGGIVYACTTKDEKQFSVRPKGTLEARQKAFADRDKNLGKLLTVRYQNLSPAGVPIFPVGITVRDYE